MSKCLCEKNWYIGDIDDTEFEHNYSCQYELYINNQPTGLTYESNTYEPRESEMSDFIDNVRKKLDEEIDNKIQNGDVVYSRELKNWTEVPDIKEVEKREIFTKKNPLTIDGMSMEELINNNKAMKQVDKSFLKENKSNKEYISLDVDMTRLTKYKGNEYKYYITNNSYFIFQKKDIEDVNKKNGLVTIKLYKDAEKYDIYTEKVIQVKEKVIEPDESSKKDNIENKDAKVNVTENVKNVKEVVAEKIDINDLVDKIKERTDTLKNRKFNTFSENIKNSFSNIRKK